MQYLSSRTGIKRQVLLLTLLPLLFVSLVLGGFFTYTRLNDAEQHMIERGQALSRLVASSAEFGLITNNVDQLQTISKGPFLEEDVADILFLNGRYELVQRSATFPVELNHRTSTMRQQGQYWFFTHPVVTTGIPFLDNPEFQETEQVIDTVGWVIVVLTDKRKQLQDRSILWASALLLAATFIASFLVAARFGQRISQPIVELTEVTNRLKTGHFEERAKENYRGDFALLAQGLNSLAETIQKAISNQKGKINIATRRLKSTLKHLEQQNEALGHARRRADEANKAKDDFLARMSHELRTPLTSVVGFAKLLQKTECSSEQLEHIRIINQTAHMLLSIIDDILDFSKLQQDAVTLERIPFSLEEAVFDILEMQAPQAHEKGLELIAHLPSQDQLQVLGDPVRVRQIFSNLVANAVKFTDRGSVEIHIDTYQVHSQQSLFTIKIIDTGIGIESEQLEQLFQAFAQADTSIKRRFGGSGLGLVIARKLTELMGGKLTMYSHPGEGTTVTIHLPMRTHQQVASLKDNPRLTTPVLFYEANASQRRATSKLLEQQIEKVDSVRSLEEFTRLLPDYSIAVLGIPAAESEQALYQGCLADLAARNLECLLITPNNFHIPQAYALHKHIKSVNKPVRGESLFQKLHITAGRNHETPQLPTFSKPLNVIVAEDNNFNRLLISRILETRAMQTYEASTGLEAIRLAEQVPVDVVIMDMHMPIMDGIEATRKIRALSPDLPIIALTASVFEQQHLALYSAGAARVLLKPINDQELIKAVEELTSADPVPEDSTLLHNTVDQHVSQAALHQELIALSKRLENAFTHNDGLALREVIHQLLGVAGLYELPEVENTATELHEHCHQSESVVFDKALWQLLWRMKRILINSAEEHSE